jgi:type I restriction enzyme M protein
MTAATHSQLASFIWSICNLLRGPYKRNEYRKVILPLTVLRRFDCLLAPTKAAVLEEYPAIKKKPETVVRSLLQKITKRPFYNLSKLDFKKLLDDPNQLAPNLNSYINNFSPNVRGIMERFGFDEQIARMSEKNLLYEVIKAFAKIDLSSAQIDNVQMGYIFEELIRIGAEQANEEAGEHFTPREVIKLMVNLLLSPEKDLTHSHVVKTIYDPACGTGGMLSVSEHYIRELNNEAKPMLYGQDWNDDAWAVCKSDMLIKGEDADNIILGDTFSKDGFSDEKFDYMLANPPFGVEWKQQQRAIEQERDSLGFQGRFGAGTPRVNDGALLFLQHMLSKMRDPKKGGSRLSIVFNGSPLFTGDAGSGESEIRRWIIENDWLEAIVALPEQLFYNTGISTYVWMLTNRKEKKRKGRVQLIDARNFWVQMEKSLGNKRRRIGDPSDKGKAPDHIGELTKIFGDFRDGHTRTFTEEDPITHQPVQRQRVVSKIFDNEDFGYLKITVERPLRLRYDVTDERIRQLYQEKEFQRLSLKQSEGLESTLPLASGCDDENFFAMLNANASFRLSAKLAKAMRSIFGVKDASKAPALRQQGINLDHLKVIDDETLQRQGIFYRTDGYCTYEVDPDLRDTETVPLKESIEVYFKREVLPHVPDAWIDTTKTKIGYEIPLNRHFYRYDPPRPLEVIETDIKRLEDDIMKMLKEVTD